MKFGFIIPNGSSNQIVKLATEAERAGWDGVFYYDDIYTDKKTEMSAAWPIMAAIAVSTKKIRFGSLLTAVGMSQLSARAMLPLRNFWSIIAKSFFASSIS